MKSELVIFLSATRKMSWQNKLEQALRKVPAPEYVEVLVLSNLGKKQWVSLTGNGLPHLENTTDLSNGLTLRILLKNRDEAIDMIEEILGEEMHEADEEESEHLVPEFFREVWVWGKAEW